MYVSIWGTFVVWCIIDVENNSAIATGQALHSDGVWESARQTIMPRLYQTANEQNTINLLSYFVYSKRIFFVLNVPLLKERKCFTTILKRVAACYGFNYHFVFLFKNPFRGKEIKN